MFPYGAIAAPEIGFDLADVWNRARQRAGLSQDALAVLMGLPNSNQLSDQLRGRGHLSLQRVLLIATDEDGRRFLRYFAMELAEASGMNFEELILVSRIERLATKLINRIQKKVPAKARLRESAERKAS